MTSPVPRERALTDRQRDEAPHESSSQPVDRPPPASGGDERRWWIVLDAYGTPHGAYLTWGHADGCVVLGRQLIEVVPTSRAEAADARVAYLESALSRLTADYRKETGRLEDAALHHERGHNEAVARAEAAERERDENEGAFKCWRRRCEDAERERDAALARVREMEKVLRSVRERFAGLPAHARTATERWVLEDVASALPLSSEEEEET